MSQFAILSIKSTPDILQQDKNITLSNTFKKIAWKFGSHFMPNLQRSEAKKVFFPFIPAVGIKANQLRGKSFEVEAKKVFENLKKIQTFKTLINIFILI